MGATQSQDYYPTAKFLSVNDKDMDEIMSEAQNFRTICTSSVNALESSEGVESGIEFGAKIAKELDIKEGIEFMGKLKATAELFGPYCAIAAKLISMLLNFCEDAESIQERLLGLKIDQAIDKAQIKFAMCNLRSEINTINNRIVQIQNDEDSIEERKNEVMMAFGWCEKVLSDFENSDHVLYQNPLITTPWLITFAQLYLSIILVTKQIKPKYEKHANDEKQRLKKVIENYKANTIKDRLKMIKIVRTDEKMMTHHYVDTVIDDFGYQSKRSERHYWNRALQPESTYNHSYISVVSIVYKKVFDDIIELFEN